jgi:hypothetical protein
LDEVELIAVAFVLSVVLGTGSLSLGYYQAGLFDPARWFIWLGILWILAHWRKLHWASSVAFLLTLVGAGYGVWHGLTIMWMLLGALGGLLAWDLSDFARRLSYASPKDDIHGMQRRHLERVGIVAALGFGLAWLSVVIRIERLAFEVAVGLVLLAALGLTRLVIGLRKY